MLLTIYMVLNVHSTIEQIAHKYLLMNGNTIYKLFFCGNTRILSIMAVLILINL